MKFRIANDKIIIDDGEETFSFPIEDFLAEETEFVMPDGQIVLFYDPDGACYVSDGTTQKTCEISTTVLDGYITKLSTYQTVVSDRHTPSMSPQNFEIAVDASNGTTVGTISASITATEDLWFGVASAGEVSNTFMVDLDGTIKMYDNTDLGTVATEHILRIIVGGQSLGYGTEEDMTIEVIA